MQVFVLVLCIQIAIAAAQSHELSAPAITPRPTTVSSAPLPPCILHCLTQAIQSSGCNINDQACACVNPTYQDTSRKCIAFTCAPDEQAVAFRLQQKCSEIPVVRSTTFPPARTHTIDANEMVANSNTASNAAVDDEPKGWWAVVGLGLILAL